MIGDFYDDFLLYLYASARAASHFSKFDIEVRYGSGATVKKIINSSASCCFS